MLPRRLDLPWNLADPVQALHEFTRSLNGSCPVGQLASPWPPAPRASRRTSPFRHRFLPPAIARQMPASMLACAVRLSYCYERTDTIKLGLTRLFLYVPPPELRRVAVSGPTTSNLWELFGRSWNPVGVGAS